MIMKKERSCIVHDGIFHADEVTAVSLLLIFDLIDREKVHRSRDPSLIEQSQYSCDVGEVYDPENLRFDHHQTEYTGTLSSAGMVLKHLFDTEVIGEGLWKYFYHNLIKEVDAHDNGLIDTDSRASFSEIIANFLPISQEVTPEEMNKAFFEAVDFTIGHLCRMKERFEYIDSIRPKIVTAMKKNGMALIFDEPLPWSDIFFEEGGEKHPAKFIVMPAGSFWKVRTISPTAKEKMKMRKPLPKEWAGLRKELLREVTGIDGAIFCHKNRFISIWETKEDALEALEKALAI